jgi:transposase
LKARVQEGPGAKQAAPLAFEGGTIALCTGWLGIDIAKQKFDVVLVWEQRKRAKVVSNNAVGYQQLLEWFSHLSMDHVHACLEATGRYGEDLAEALADAGHGVSLINPAQIRDFARSKLSRNKTDPVDAELIGEFFRLMKPMPRRPLSPAQRHLRDLVRTREALVASRVEWTNRSGSGHHSTEVRTAILTIIEQFERQIRALDAVINQDVDLKSKHDLLVSVPGVSTQTATVILAACRT